MKNRNISSKIKRSKVTDYAALNMQKSNPSHAFAGDGNIYLHDGDVLDICLNVNDIELGRPLRQTDLMTYIPRFAKTRK